jgi:hypothetical protein
MRANYVDAARIARFGEGVAVMHVRFAGQSFNVPLASLDLSGQSPDRQVKLAVARYLSLPDGAMETYVIDRHANGNLTIRPEAVFG